MNVPSDNTELIKIAVELRPKVIKALASKFEHTLTKEGVSQVHDAPFFYLETRKLSSTYLLIDIGGNNRHITTFFDLNQQIPIFCKKTR